MDNSNAQFEKQLNTMMVTGDDKWRSVMISDDSWWEMMLDDMWWIMIDYCDGW